MEPRDPKSFSILFGLKIMHGHHRACEGFARHEFQLGKKTFCAACTGLLLGALITLLGTAMYFFADLQTKQGVLLFAVGVPSVALGLLQFTLFEARGFLRLFLNTFFVLGISGLIYPITVAASTGITTVFMVLMSILLLVFVKSNWELRKNEGLLLLALYFAFLLGVFFLP